MADSPGLMGLSTALEGLREELQDSWEKSKGKPIRFGVSNVTLTLEAVARWEGKAGGKIRWWLVEAGGEATKGTETTQTLVLTLTPGMYDPLTDEPRGPLVTGRIDIPGED
jgi:Trypsin-co-occurring domain 2